MYQLSFNRNSQFDEESLVNENQILTKNFKITDEIITNMDELTGFINEIKCQRCSTIPIIPEICKQCGQLYCKPCFDSEKSKNTYQFSEFCCKTIFKRTDKNKPNLLYTLLNKIQFYCKNKQFGCEILVMYGEKEVHENLNCNYQVIKCPHKACQLQNFRKDILIHQDICKFKPFPCPYCKEEFYRDQIDTHKENCEMRPVKCKWCGEEKIFKELNFHESMICEFREIQCEQCFLTIKFNEQEKHSGIPCQKKQRNYYQRKYFKLKSKNEDLEEVEQLNQQKIIQLKKELEELQIQQNLATRNSSRGRGGLRKR